MTKDEQAEFERRHWKSVKNHHEEMAEAARRWLHTYAPEVLQDFDRIYLDHSTSV